MSPRFVERESEGVGRDTASAIVIPVGWPGAGGGRCAKDEENESRVHHNIYFLDSSDFFWTGMPESFLGIKAREVSIHPPQEHPPPPSGTRNRPWEGRKLSQHDGRRRGQCVGFFSS